MQISTFTVSYLNDLDSHAQWLHPFYASLQNELSDENVSWNHYIALNDENKDEAKENILKVVSKYGLNFYTPHFLSFDIDPVLQKSTVSHHGKTLTNLIDSISGTDVIEKTDLFLIEEYDLIHDRNYYQEIKKLLNFSKSCDSFFGTIQPGCILISEEKLNRLSVIGCDQLGEIRSRSGDVYYWLPRVMPHFFGFSSKLISNFYSLNAEFQSEITSHVEHISAKKDSAFRIYSDSGNDIFRDLIGNENFFHMKDPEVVNHIKGISMNYNKLSKNIGDRKYLYQRLERKFEKIKENFSYLPFHDECIFTKDEFERMV